MEWCHRCWNYERWNYEVLFQLESIILDGSSQCCHKILCWNSRLDTAKYHDTTLEKILKFSIERISATVSYEYRHANSIIYLTVNSVSRRSNDACIMIRVLSCETALRCVWLKRLEKLLCVYSKSLFKKILFTLEIIFTKRQKFSKQTKKLYAWTPYEAKAKVPRIQRGHSPFSVIVWCGGPWNGVAAIHFCVPGIKTTAKIYEETVFQPIVKILNDTLFKGQHWIFQLDSVLAHKSKHF